MRYPIILAHGILMKPQVFRAFEHIQKKLLEEGYRVYAKCDCGYLVL